MKVCLVSDEIAGVRGGGIGTYVREAGRALAARGHEVWLLTSPIDAPVVREALGASPDFHRVLFTDPPPNPDHGQRFFHGGDVEAYAYRVHQALAGCGERFDYVEFPDCGAEGLVTIREHRLFAAYGECVIGMMLHGPMYDTTEFNGRARDLSLNDRIRCVLEDNAIRDVPMLSSPSLGLRKVVARRLGLDENRILVRRYPMTLPETAPAPVRTPRTLADLRFLYFGRIEPRKGVRQLVEAFRRLPDLQLELVGGDTPFSPDRRSFKDFLERTAPPNARFRPAMTRDRLLVHLTEVDVCIFPSVFENWPNACLEAMAAGRVVVGSRHGGMSEMIEHGKSGFLTDGRDPDDIVRTIEEIGSHLDRVSDIGQEASRRARLLSDPSAFCDTLEAQIDQHRTRPTPPRSPDSASKLVSVVIPFHDDRGTIGDAVQSATQQSYANLEVIVVDDGSPLTDATDILEGLRERDPRVRIVRQPNAGLSSARNTGVEQARGDYVLFLDADNVLYPDYAQRGIEALEARPECGFAVPYIRYRDETGRAHGIYNPLPYDRSLALLRNRFGDAGAFFRRDVFVEAGVRYDTDMTSYEDWALWMDLDRRGVRGVVIPRVLYQYSWRSSSMMAQHGWPNHDAHVGRLIDRHFGPRDAAERDMLLALNRTWADEFGTPPLRHIVADRLARAARFLGPLRRPLLWMMRAAVNPARSEESSTRRGGGRAGYR